MVSLGALYAGDYSILRYRIWRGREPYGQVTVHHYDAVPLRNGKTEIFPLAPDNETCVHSLFPHFAFNPCWYVSRHTEDRIDL